MALLLLLNKILHAADSGMSSLLVSLDLSAAFDTTDHSILFDRLTHSFYFTDMALSWIQSYLTDRSYSVRLGQHSLPMVSCCPCPGLGSWATSPIWVCLKLLITEAYL